MQLSKIHKFRQLPYAVYIMRNWVSYTTVNKDCKRQKMFYLRIKTNTSYHNVQIGAIYKCMQSFIRVLTLGSKFTGKWVWTPW